MFLNIFVNIYINIRTKKGVGTVWGVRHSNLFCFTNETGFYFKENRFHITFKYQIYEFRGKKCLTVYLNVVYHNYNNN